MYYKDTIELDEMNFAVYLEHDDDMAPPWKEHNFSGPVSDWTSRDKRPGELVLNEDRGCKQFYDYQEACRIACICGCLYSLPLFAAVFIACLYLTLPL